MNGFLGFLKWCMGVFLLTGRQHFDFFQTTACVYFNTYPRLGFQSFFFCGSAINIVEAEYTSPPPKLWKLKSVSQLPLFSGTKYLINSHVLCIILFFRAAVHPAVDHYTAEAWKGVHALLLHDYCAIILLTIYTQYIYLTFPDIPMNVRRPPVAQWAWTSVNSWRATSPIMVIKCRRHTKKCLHSRYIIISLKALVGFRKTYISCIPGYTGEQDLPVIHSVSSMLCGPPHSYYGYLLWHHIVTFTRNNWSPTRTSALHLRLLIHHTAQPTAPRSTHQHWAWLLSLTIS
jgi:hypothetical protein